MSIYYRSVMSKNEARLYDTILSGVASWQDEIAVGRWSLEDAMRMYALVLLDNPELFHALPQVRSRGNGFSTSLFPEYAFDRSAVNARWQAIDAHVYDYKRMLSSSAGDYEKAEVAYEYIIKLCEYGYSEDDQNMCSVLVDEISCCTGYSKAFAYLLSTVGVVAPVITGDSRSANHGSGPHAWNAIRIDGRWSWCDATWGDPVSVSGRKRLSEVVYDYLCVSERELSSSHFISQDIARFLPRCDSQHDSWYANHHLLFASYDADDVAKALQGDVLGREIGFGRDFDGDAYAKFTNSSAYHEAKRHLCEQMAIMSIISPVYAAYNCTVSNFAYSCNDEMLTLHITYDIIRNR